MTYKLKHGQALVIIGPQGCGKTTLARKIAEQYGRFVETDARQLETHRGVNELLINKPNTVICEGMPKSEVTLARLKDLIVGGPVMMDRKGLAPEMVEAPNFIFCTGDEDPIPLAFVDRRFQVLTL